MAINNYNDWLKALGQGNFSQKWDLFKNYPQYAKQFASTPKLGLNQAANNIKQIGTKSIPNPNLDTLFGNARNIGEELGNASKVAIKAGKTGIRGKLGPVIGGALTAQDVYSAMKNPNLSGLSKAQVGVGDAMALAGWLAPTNPVIKGAAILGGTGLSLLGRSGRNESGVTTDTDPNNLINQATKDEYKKYFGDADPNEIAKLVMDTRRGQVDGDNVQDMGDTTQANSSYTPMVLPPTTGLQSLDGVPTGNAVGIGGTGSPYGQYQSALDAANLINSYVGGVQSTLQYPNVGITPEEVNAYKDMIAATARNANVMRPQLKAVANAVNRDYRNQAIASGMDSLGSIASAFLPNTASRYVVNPLTLNAQELNWGEDGRKQLGSVGTDTLAKLPNNTQRALQQLEIANKANTIETDAYKQAAKLASALNIAQNTGLPLGMAMDLTSENYLKSFIDPITKLSNDVTLEGAKTYNDMVKKYPELQNALDVQRLSNQGSYNVAAVNNIAGINTATIGAESRKEVAKILGTNQQELEKLKQKDPATYAKVIGNVFSTLGYVNPQMANQFTPIVTQTLADYAPASQQELYKALLQNNQQPQQQGMINTPWRNLGE